MIEYEKNVIMCPDNDHYDYPQAEEALAEICEMLDVAFAILPMSGNDFGFGYAQKILFSKHNLTEWTEEEMKELDEEISERLH